VSALLWSLVGLPLVAGVALACAGRRADRVALPAAVGVAAATLALAVAAALARPTAEAPFLAVAPLSLAVDALSALMVVTVATVTVLVLAASGSDVGRDQPRARYAGLMLLFAGAVLVTVTATNLLTLLLAWEGMGATSYALIAFSWRDSARVASGTTAFLVTRAADLGLYAAAAAALAGAGTLAYADLPSADGGWLDLLTAGVVVAALGKAAQLPFAFWLSRAMQGPSPVSALLHSAAMVAAGAYLLLRLQPVLAASGWGGPAVAWVGAGTALLLGAVAVAQRDLKQLLAASTSAQLGFVVLAAGVGGVTGGLAHLIAHASVKSLLFLAAGAWLSALGSKDLRALRGAARRHPVVGGAATAGLLALAGVPPLSLWATKDEVLAAALARQPLLYVVGLAAAALSALYAGKALVLLVRPAPLGTEAWFDTERRGTREVGAPEWVVLVVLAVGAVGLGALALPPVAHALAEAIGAPEAPTPGPLELLASAGVALGALALAWRRPERPVPLPRVAGSWLGLEAAAHALVVRPTLALAHGLAALDDRALAPGVDAVGTGVLRVARGLAWTDDSGAARGVDAVGAGTLRTARGIAWTDDRGVDAVLVRGATTATRGTARAVSRLDDDVVDAAVRAVAAGARSLGRLARRPQTGQLHQYYAQVSAGLVVLFAVLLLVR
jgi:NADH-quinone oxidoreductase subunit L